MSKTDSFDLTIKNLGSEWIRGFNIIGDGSPICQFMSISLELVLNTYDRLIVVKRS